VGAIIAQEVTRGRDGGARPAFRYRDRGTMAVIGNAKAVAQIGRFKFGGFFAWLLWAGIHIAFLVGFHNRLQVLLSWFWNWLFNNRDARLITGNAQLEIHSPRPRDFIRTSPDADRMNK
jgi:NADH:ubiquinone reductase (H+-translocating)